MQRTDNFNLIVVEGSDTVNLLTQMNPNTEAIDEQMFKNQNAGVQTATELLSGTVHAITRSVPDASMLRFTAVSRFTAGDTFTVDGVQVSALLPSGEQLPDGAFIIGSEVLCVLKGTLLTVFASGGAVALAKDAEKLGGNLPSYYATKDEVNSAQNTANSAGNLAESNKRNIDEIGNYESIGSYSSTISKDSYVTISLNSSIENYRKIIIELLFTSVMIPIEINVRLLKHYIESGIESRYAVTLNTSSWGCLSINTDSTVTSLKVSNYVNTAITSINVYGVK